MAELALDNTPDFGDYLAGFRRRQGTILLVAGTIFLLGLITAFVWPPTYQSSATILIEEQEIPTDLIQTTVTSYAAQRIQVISQRVMTRSNLLGIIEEYGLYKDELKKDTTEEVLGEMRGDIGIDMVTAELMDPRTGRPTAATIAFNVSYKSTSAEKSQKVAGVLTTLYLNENLKSRTEKAAETFDFLNKEAGRLNDEIARLETVLSNFKERNINRLPELRDLNTQVLQRTEREVAALDTQILSLEERKIYMIGQLESLDPYGAMADEASPKARLGILRSQRTTLTSRYSPSHPDLLNLNREIKALEIETGDFDSSEELRTQLDMLRVELATAEQTYTPEHPDVKSLKRQVANLEDQLENPTPTAKTNTAYRSPGNPAYVNLQTQLAATESQLSSLKARRLELQDKVSEYEVRLIETPKVEQSYRIIMRDLNNASSRYQEIRAKEMRAEVGQEMEKERKGEKFTLIDPPVMPEEPISPNRPAIIFLSLVLALGAGVGTAAVAESMDSAIRGAKGLVAILHTAPLAVIPYLPNETDTSAVRRKRTIIIFSIVAGLALILTLIHFLYSPLDVLWFRGLRKVDKIVGE